MLPQYLRFTILNDVGVTIPAGGVTIKGRLWKYDANGNITWSNELTLFALAADVLDNAYASGDVYDNSVNAYTGGFFRVDVTGPTSANGDVTVYFEPALNGSTFSTNGQTRAVQKVNFTTSGSKSRDFEI